MNIVQLNDRVCEFNDITRKIEEILSTKDCRLHGAEILDVVGDLAAKAFIALVREYVHLNGKPYTSKQFTEQLGSSLTTSAIVNIRHELRKEKAELERYAIITIMDHRAEETKKEMLLMHQSFSQLITYLETGNNKKE